MKIEILDHGYVQYIEHWGSDERIIESARMSTQKGFLGWGNDTEPGDEKLLRYLYTHKHMTPFEMGGLIIEVQAPIFIFREWHRHRTQSYNEMSARYIPLPNLNYVPTKERLLQSSEKNKQAGALAQLSEAQAGLFIKFLAKSYDDQQSFYEAALQEGVPKELARLILPVGRYSKMRASANLRNWLQFLTLRLDENAQWEIRQYAEAINTIIKQYFNRTWQLFTEKI